MGKQQKISILIACYNEDAIINICHNQVAKSIKDLPCDFEIIYVDDGSTDDSLSKLKAIQQQDDRVVVISLSRNFGKEAAMTAGIDLVRGDAVIIMDADLQDPPELIDKIIKVWHETNADIVYGQRLKRDGESWLKKTTATGFYKVMGRITQGISIPKNTGDFRLMNRRSINALKQLKEKQRFMKGLFAWIGFHQVSMTYDRSARIGGSTKWNYFKLWGLAVEGITSFSTLPLRLATILGSIISLISFIYGGYVLVYTLLFGSATDGWPTLVILISFLSGIQLLSIGVLGEYIGRIFSEVKNRPIYFIDTIYQKKSPDKKAT